MQLRKKISHLFQPRALVLMYHRIAELKTDPWQLAVSPRNFEEHLQVLQKTGNVVSVEEMVTALRYKAVRNNSICITFDDGYRDNYYQAKPLLEKYKSPATFFIPTCYMGRDQSFWWDELEHIMLCSAELPSKLSLQIKGALFEYDLGSDVTLTDAQLKEQQSWRWPAVVPTRRCELYLQIWERIRQLSYEELQLILDEIKSWATFEKPGDPENFPMTNQQLKDLAAHAFIDIGLHTHTHPALSYHSKQVQHAEISLNKQLLENMYEEPIETIAYPYGKYNNTTLDVAKELNITAAFTTAEKIVSNLTNPLEMGRFQVRNWSGSEFENRLVKWKQSSQYL